MTSASVALPPSDAGAPTAALRCDSDITDVMARSRWWVSGHDPRRREHHLRAERLPLSNMQAQLVGWHACASGLQSEGSAVIDELTFC